MWVVECACRPEKGFQGKGIKISQVHSAFSPCITMCVCMRNIFAIRGPSCALLQRCSGRSNAAMISGLGIQQQKKDSRQV